jgi:hypothetical protein
MEASITLLRWTKRSSGVSPVRSGAFPRIPAKVSWGFGHEAPEKTAEVGRIFEIQRVGNFGDVHGGVDQKALGLQKKTLPDDIARGSARLAANHRPEVIGGNVQIFRIIRNRSCRTKMLLHSETKIPFDAALHAFRQLRATLLK